MVLRNKDPVYTQAGPFCIFYRLDALIDLSSYFSDPESNDLFFTSNTTSIWNTTLDVNSMELYGNTYAANNNYNYYMQAHDGYGGSSNWESFLVRF